MLSIPRPTDTGLLAIVVTSGLVVWFVLAHHNPTSDVSHVAPVPISAPPSRAARAKASNAHAGRLNPVILTRAELERVARSLGQPVFWLGPLPGFRFALSWSPQGAVVRYLPPGVKAGDPRKFLAIGTYPFPGAFATAQEATRFKDNRWLRLPGGGLATYLIAQPKNFYVAFPGVNDKVQVYDPSPAVVRALVARGLVQRLA
jgi:hypothetical protein